MLFSYFSALSEFSMPSHFVTTSAEKRAERDYIFVFWMVFGGFCFTHGHARVPSVGVAQGHSKSTGATSRGLVFTNHCSFEHSKTTTVHGTPKCANPPTLGEIHAISFSAEFSSTLDDLNMTPRSMAMGKTRPLRNSDLLRHPYIKTCFKNNTFPLGRA